jgi:hypothetical protein
MNKQWPSERLTEKRKVFADSSFKTVDDFFSLLNVFSVGLPRDFDDITTWVAAKGGDLTELEQRIAPIIGTAYLQTYPDSHALLMTLVCAVALARTPSLQTWSKVKTFKSNSVLIEHSLAEAMMAYAKFSPSACNAYSLLAKEAFTALDNLTMASSFSHINKERTDALAYWNERTDKLEEIWWDLRGWHGLMNYEEELPLFQVFYNLEPDEFIRTISGSSNPYLVSALLFVASIGAFSPQFSEWKRMIATAPTAFEDEGSWNGSVLIPLLLVEARNQLLQVQQNLHNSNLSPSERDEIKQEIINTAELIATTLAARHDASATFARWTPWLMRQILGQSEKEITDIKSTAFADGALIDVIGCKLKSSALPQASPEDAPLWETWCYRCVLASFASNGHSQVPDWTSFGDEWKLSLEDWASTKGHCLRERASLITTLSKEIPGVAANLLAYPITQTPFPDKIWINLWNDAVTLREIVEFGDADASKDEYSSRSEAGRLLLLLFRIGLAIFDQGAARSSNNNSPQARSLANLFKALNLATYEMREIDSTLNYDEWLATTQHLAVRRMIWESTSDNESASKNFQVFKVDDAPTIFDILAKAKSDVIELVAILQSLLLNSPDALKLKAILNSASIDFSNIVPSIRSLNQYHPRKYPIDETQLQKLEALICPQISDTR